MEGKQPAVGRCREERDKSEKKARISRGRGSGKKGTWKIDYFAVGHDIH
jgi:hypothetical protein